MSSIATAATPAPVRPRRAARASVKIEPMAAGGSPSREEERLAKALRERDPDALRAAYDRFGRITFGFLVKALGDRGAAEDVQQQVFLEVWRRADRYDPERGRLLTWVMTIARSRAIDQIRRRVPEPVDPGSAARSVEGAAVGADERIERLAEQWRMRALLDALPEREAELLRHRFYEELTQTEIAERQEIPLGTVKTRMVSGLRRLRELIEEEEAR